MSGILLGMRAWLCGAALLLFAAPVLAQSKAAHTVVAPEPMGTVTGHVTCSDTQRPARFADVFLLPMKGSRKPAEGSGLGARSEKGTPAVVMVKTRTGLDGGFRVGNVPPGDYYTIAHSRGYALPPIADAAPDGAGDAKVPDESRALRNFPVVHVVADRVVNAELSMERGGAIFGRVHFEDGTPVSGMDVTLSRADGKEPERRYLGMQLMGISLKDRYVETDDEGRYRMTGLSPGKYTVSVMLEAEDEAHNVGTDESSYSADEGTFFQQRVTVFSPASFRRADAKEIEVRGDEQLGDNDIEVKLDGLHTVRGRLVGGEDHHALNNGFVVLTDGEDFERDTALKPDGSFHFSFVPSGSYKLRVKYAADITPNLENHWDPTVLKRYEGAEQALLLGEHDVTVDDLVLTEGKKAVRKMPQEENGDDN